MIENIDWEKLSITKIQRPVPKARINLQDLIENVNQRLPQMCRWITTNFLSANKRDDFSEVDIEQ